jgi:GxxExxY protein
MEIEEFVHKIYTSLGPGYSESVYHRAFEVLLRRQGISYETERIVPIVFDEHTIGNLRVDLIINGKCIVELKATIAKLNDAAKIQVQNYLKLTGLSEAYLINFSSQVPEILKFGQQV